MEAVSSFRGWAGEVVNKTLRYETWISIICIVALWFTAALIALAVGPLSIALFILLTAYILGRFAIPASRGDFTYGFLSSQIESGEAFLFALRLILSVVLWAVPAVFLVWLLLPSGEGLGFFSGASGLLSLGVRGVLLLIVFMFMFLAPALSIIIATATDSFSAVFSFDPWRWLYRERWNDLAAFYAAAIGGMLVFLAVYIVPYLIITALMVKVAPAAGAFMLAFVPALPSLVAPILLGRLAGAFVLGGDSLGESAKIGVISPAGALSGEPAPVQVEIAAARGQAQTRPPEQGAAASARFSPLTTDPTNELIVFLKNELRQQPDVEGAYIFNSPRPGETAVYMVGLVLDPSTKLGSRQKLIKDLSVNFLQAPIQGAKPRVTILDADTIAALEETGAGLRFYRRKTGSA